MSSLLTQAVLSDVVRGQVAVSFSYITQARLSTEEWNHEVRQRSKQFQM